MHPQQICKYSAVLCGFLTLCLAPSNLFATALPITDNGILAIANLGGTLLGITSSPSTCINWGGGSSCVSGTTHQMAVSGISNLFSTTSSATDEIKDLGLLPPPTIVDFETVEGAGALAGQTIHFDLTSLPLTNGGAGFGNCLSNAPNNSCSPPGSPFTLQENSTGTDLTLSFSVLLHAYTGSSASGFSSYVGTFSTDYALSMSGSSPCNGLAANITNFLSCEAAGGTVSSTWSATEAPAPVTTPTPEPATYMLLGAGLLAVHLVKRCCYKS